MTANISHKLELSIAIELLDKFIESQYSRFSAGEEFTEEELQNLERAINYWQGQTGRKKSGYAASIATELEKLQAV